MVECVALLDEASTLDGPSVKRRDCLGGVKRAFSTTDLT